MLALLTGSTATAGVVLAALAAYVWRRRGSAAGLSLAVLLLSVAWWAVAYSMELLSDDLTVRGRWGDAKYLGICLVPAAWLTFAVQYTGRGRLVTRRVVALLAVEPAAILLLLAIPATHDLVRYYQRDSVGHELPLVGAGPLFWVHLLYANVVVLTATAVFVLGMARLSRVYRLAALVLVAAALLPWCANLLYNFAVGPFARIDLTPFAFVATGGVLVWGLFRERLINLSSVAWELVVHTMTDAVILADAFGRVRDVNPASVRLLGQSRAELIGRDVGQLLPVRTTAARGGAGSPAVTEAEFGIELPVGPRHLEVRRQVLPDPVGAPSGELLVLRDITVRKESEERLRQLLDERTRVAATLQASLLPDRLPLIPGHELAARYEPAGDGREIGGDFYDVFPLDTRRWGVFLGDVSGKGAEAAAVTALVRYTLRALALWEPKPELVLRRLNEVLLRDTDDERFCTLVYAVVSPEVDGLEVQLCLAGHYQPLIRGLDGAVRPIGVLGTALGIVPDPDLMEVTIRLLQGELVCMFTDGLVEAQDGDDLFGFERPAALLAKTQSSAKAVVDDLAQAAHLFSHGVLRDDLAILAVSVEAADTD